MDQNASTHAKTLHWTILLRIQEQKFKDRQKAWRMITSPFRVVDFNHLDSCVSNRNQCVSPRRSPWNGAGENWNQNQIKVSKKSKKKSLYSRIIPAFSIGGTLPWWCTIFHTPSCFSKTLVARIRPFEPPACTISMHVTYACKHSTPLSMKWCQFGNHSNYWFFTAAKLNSFSNSICQRSNCKDGHSPPHMTRFSKLVQRKGVQSTAHRVASP